MLLLKCRLCASGMGEEDRKPPCAGRANHTLLQGQVCVHGTFRKGDKPDSDDLKSILRAGGAHLVPLAEAAAQGADLAVLQPGRAGSDPQARAAAYALERVLPSFLFMLPWRARGRVWDLHAAFCGPVASRQGACCCAPASCCCC